MAINVPYLTKESIERSAELLLLNYKHVIGLDCVLPIPVERILERYLKLTLDFDDLHEKLGIPIGPDGPDVLGALWTKTKQVFIDASLDPDVYPQREGRYRFTLAHEIGHWHLHRNYLEDSPTESVDKSPVNKDSPIISRVSEAGKRIEWQADYFASSLLMPRRVMDVCWREMFSRSTPLVFEVFEGCSDWTKPPAWWTRTSELPVRLTNRFDPRAISYFFYRTSRVLAPLFGVSLRAMEVRLQQLGLLRLERLDQAVA